jgi:hypothetical protein
VQKGLEEVESRVRRASARTRGRCVLVRAPPPARLPACVRLAGTGGPAAPVRQG